MGADGVDDGGDEYGDLPYVGDFDDPAAEGYIPEREPRASRSISIERRDLPICPGAPHNVMEVAYQLFVNKIESNQKDNEFNRYCKLHSQYALPEGNFYPPSLHVCKVILDIEEVSKYERHVCVNDCTVFPIQREEDWLAHRQDRCPHCEEKRFEEYRVAAGPCARPCKVFWYFGVAETMQEYFNDKEFCRLRRYARLDTSDFWSGAYADRINLCSPGNRSPRSS
jgi:hypothetical protein